MLQSLFGVVLTIVAVACQLDAGAQDAAGLVTYRQERLPAGTLVRAFDDQQIAMLEKINRADRPHLERLGSTRPAQRLLCSWTIPSSEPGGSADDSDA